MAILWGLCSIFIAFCACHNLDNYFGNNNFFYHALGLAIVVLLLGIWFVAIWQLGKGVLRERLLFCLVFGLMSLAPLLIVHPLPIRVVFQSYVFFAAAAMLCADALGKKLELHWLNLGRAVALLVAVVYVLNLSFVYSFIAHASKLREDYILEQIDQRAESIDVFTIEYGYVYDSYMDALAVAYYEKIAGRPLTFHEMSQASWMGYHG